MVSIIYTLKPDIIQNIKKEYENKQIKRLSDMLLE